MRLLRAIKSVVGVPMVVGVAVFVTTLQGCKAGRSEELAGRSGSAAVADTTDEPIILITGPARAALDSGNALYKAKRYSHALQAYRSAARLAPTEPAPLFGMLMAATLLEDSRLADSVRAAISANTAPRIAAPPKR